jgi:hypothetical protein
MKFWKLLRWIGALTFIAILLTSWLAQDNPTTGNAGAASDPPPAPTFR